MSPRVANAQPYEESPSGEASSYIDSWSELRRHDRVLLLAVVSGRESKRKQALDDQLLNLGRWVRRRKAIVVGSSKYIGHRDQSAWFEEVVAEAKRLGATTIVAETADRLARHPDFHVNDRPNIRPTKKQWKALYQIAQQAGLTIVTHQRPDACPRHQRAYQRKRGIWAKKQRLPGYKKMRRIKLQPKVREMWEQGCTARELRDKFGVCLGTIHAWAK